MSAEEPPIPLEAQEERLVAADECAADRLKAMKRRCLHGVIGFCVACTIAAALLPSHIDRDDHEHPDPARVEYVGSTGLVVQPTSDGMPVGASSTNLPSFANRNAQYAVALRWWGEPSTPLPMRATSVAATS